MLSLNMTVARTRPRCLPQVDDFLGQAIRELGVAIDDISLNAAILELEFARDPAHAGLRALVRDLRVQTLNVSRVLDAALEGQRQWS
jgi:hypothetical protein